jgi:hypothetical protein
MPQPGSGKIERRLSVRECADHAGAPPDLRRNALEWCSFEWDANAPPERRSRSASPRALSPSARPLWLDASRAAFGSLGQPSVVPPQYPRRLLHGTRRKRRRVLPRGGVAIVSIVAAPFCCPGCVSHVQFSQISGPPALFNCAKPSVRHLSLAGATGSVRP